LRGGCFGLGATERTATLVSPAGLRPAPPLPRFAVHPAAPRPKQLWCSKVGSEPRCWRLECWVSDAAKSRRRGGRSPTRGTWA